MADDAGPAPDDLTAAVAAAVPGGLEASELLRRLERGGGRFGHAGPPAREPARLGQHLRLAFATRDVAEAVVGAAGRPARVVVVSPGLLGPEGPLPLHLTGWVLERLSQRWFAGGAEGGATSDTTFLDFANMLQHRQIALFYRAWADARPEVQAERAGGGRPRAIVGALAGMGLPGAEDAEFGSLRLAFAPALARQVQGPERLTGLLAAALRVPVALGEFVGAWTWIPARLQTRLGGAGAALGRGATTGPRTFRRQDRVEVRLGPLAWPEFERFLPGGPGLATLAAATRRILGDTLEVAARLALRPGEVPAARLGATRLGRDGWLAPRADAGAELRLGRLVAGGGAS
ncbi:type VI secretion system baseplate subunit TssG [Amaricoccus sp.]|uniref:type VI secretion system baseplate subunit TssG n=1 Tax=Amaricoccus sp. TaxID=1872485 RepID=UPI001B64F56E|nr:type VI secretion system baseplate subunit TssG [Amaricoccus sp.]MBP7241242.1 type VI secretion system baseplate subunit TssG [Amaricoccus sp.]